jgi:hypothetical protein
MKLNILLNLRCEYAISEYTEVKNVTIRLD